MGRPRPGCKTHRLRFVALSASVLAALAWTLAIAAPPTSLSSPIAPQSLATAIERFQELTGINVSWPPNVDVSALHSKGATAGLTPQEALKQLLRDTGLAFTPTSERIMRI